MGEIAPARAPVRFRVTSKKSRLYHADAIAQRLQAIVGGTPGGGPSTADDAADEGDPAVQLFIVRVLRDLVTISADSSGALLHRRGYRPAGGKAPLRETFAAAMLLRAGYDGSAPLVDPFCWLRNHFDRGGAAGAPDRAGTRPRLCLSAVAGIRCGRLGGPLTARASERILPAAPAVIAGSDRDAGAIALAEANAARAGVAGDIGFRTGAVSTVHPPAGPGLLVTNPPYGVRIGAVGRSPRSLCPARRADPGALDGVDRRDAGGGPDAGAGDGSAVSGGMGIEHRGIPIRCLIRP